MKQQGRNRKQAISTEHGGNHQAKQTVVHLLSWLLFCIAVALCIVGLWFGYGAVQDGQQIDLQITGTRSDKELAIIKQQLHDVEQQKYYTVDLIHIRDQVLQQKWVDEVAVSREWPNKIAVQVLPQHAVARWNDSGLWVSDQGELFELHSPQPLQSVPTLSGPENQIPRMMTLLQEVNHLFKPVGMKLTRMHLTDRMTWILQFDNGKQMIVDKENTLHKLQRLSRLAQGELQAEWATTQHFDLRYRDGLAIR